MIRSLRRDAARVEAFLAEAQGPRKEIGATVPAQ